jgi:type II secretory pathway pseudopilin PulG
MGGKGQLSAEMLVVLVVILGLAVILASTMLKSANKAAASADAKTNAVLEASDQGVLKGTAGDYCASNFDCESNSCDSYVKKCN